MKNINSFNRREFMKLAGMAGGAALIAPNLAFAEEILILIFNYNQI